MEKSLRADLLRFLHYLLWKWSESDDTSVKG